MTEIEHRVGVAKQLAANIREGLGKLTPEQWELPSACAELRWTQSVGQVWCKTK